MKAGGCDGVEFGLDVASDKMLAALNKPFGTEGNPDCPASGA